MSESAADNVYMYGSWNPSSRAWVGKWSQDKHMQGPTFDFSYSPKNDTQINPKSPCELCKRPIDKEKYYGCYSCDRYAIHVGCYSGQVAWTCQPCSDLNSRFGQIPPVARTWSGFFELSSEQGNHRYDDQLRLECNYNHKSERDSIVAMVSGKGENQFGVFVIKGYVLRGKRDYGGDTFEIKVLKQYDTSQNQQSAMSMQQQQQQPPPPSNQPPPYGAAHSIPVPNLSLASQRIRRRDDDPYSQDDTGEDRDRKRSRSAYGKIPHRNATFVTSAGIEGNISSLIDVWRAVSHLSDSLSVLCLSGPASTIPLRTLVRVHQSNENISHALRSPSAMAACSAACQAVDSALENNSGAMSCASLDRKSQFIIPAALAASYIVERYGKTVGVVDLCPPPSYLSDILRGAHSISAFHCHRDVSGDVRTWRDGVSGIVNSLRSQQHDVIVVSTILGEFDPLEYGWVTDTLCSIGIPLVIIVEDVTSPRADKCARMIMETMLRKFASPAEGSSFEGPTAAPPAQPPTPISYPPPIPSIPSTGYSSGPPMPANPANISATHFPSKPIGMYQAAMANVQMKGPSQPQPQPQQPQPPQVQPSKPVTTGPIQDKNRILPPPGQSYPGVKQAAVAPPQAMSSQPSGTSQPVKPPPMGISVGGGNSRPPPMPSHPANTPPMNSTSKLQPKPINGVPPGSNVPGGPMSYSAAGGVANSRNGNSGYPAPPNLAKQSSGGNLIPGGIPSSLPALKKNETARQNSPMRQPPPPGYSQQQQQQASESSYVYDLPPDLLEPLPFMREPSVNEPPPPEPPPIQMKTTNGSVMSSVPLSINSQHIAPPQMERQDSWDLGAESPRPNGANNKFDYITAGFKS